jgi:hypothetical protein
MDLPSRQFPSCSEVIFGRMKERVCRAYDRLELCPQPMKIFLTCGVVLELLALSALGIPQTFGTNQFLNTAGVSFEEFATDPAAWGDASALKGHWAARPDTLTLHDSAVVFGITAAEVTAIS